MCFVLERVHIDNRHRRDMTGNVCVSCAAFAMHTKPSVKLLLVSCCVVFKCVCVCVYRVGIMLLYCYTCSVSNSKKQYTRRARYLIGGFYLEILVGVLYSRTNTFIIINSS